MIKQKRLKTVDIYGKSAKIDREVEQVKKWKNFVEKGV